MWVGCGVAGRDRERDRQDTPQHPPKHEQPLTHRAARRGEAAAGGRGAAAALQHGQRRGPADRCVGGSMDIHLDTCTVIPRVCIRKHTHTHFFQSPSTPTPPTNQTHNRVRAPGALRRDVRAGGAVRPALPSGGAGAPGRGLARGAAAPGLALAGGADRGCVRLTGCRYMYLYM